MKSFTLSSDSTQIIECSPHTSFIGSSISLEEGGTACKVFCARVDENGNRNHGEDCLLCTLREGSNEHASVSFVVSFETPIEVWLVVENKTKSKGQKVRVCIMGYTSPVMTGHFSSSDANKNIGNEYSAYDDSTDNSAHSMPVTRVFDDEEDGYSSEELRTMLAREEGLEAEADSESDASENCTGRPEDVPKTGGSSSSFREAGRLGVREEVRTGEKRVSDDSRAGNDNFSSDRSRYHGVGREEVRKEKKTKRGVANEHDVGNATWKGVEKLSALGKQQSKGIKGDNKNKGKDNDNKDKNKDKGKDKGKGKGKGKDEDNMLDVSFFRAAIGGD